MNKNEKLPCFNYGVHCSNTVVAECDLGDGKGIQLYCRSCIEDIDVDEEDWERDDSLVFCNREWELQAK